MKVNVYVNFAGNTEEAFEFYRSLFGGEFSSFVRYKDLPMVRPEVDDQPPPCMKVRAA